MQDTQPNPLAPNRSDSFNIEALVSCIRTNRSRQSQQQALRLMSGACSLLPDLVLLHVMSVFAFVGDSLRRHDDIHTFRVIDNTIDAIVPVLIRVRNPRAVFPPLLAHLLGDPHPRRCITLSPYTRHYTLSLNELGIRRLTTV